MSLSQLHVEKNKIGPTADDQAQRIDRHVRRAHDTMAELLLARFPKQLAEEMMILNDDDIHGEDKGGGGSCK